ncbi:WG repeat-containing protein [Psychroserpens sp.]|uniref:WG repeat-containing protein n=1 Tax=Psychroserpens sp. TaxID=2020870 RepID=UPI00385DB9B1
MKNLSFVLVMMTISLFGFSQSLENVDFISPFNEGFAAIQKDGQWSFINQQGILIMDFRSDLVVSQNLDGSFPVFSSGRCLIEEKRNGISYFGYINTCGTKIIEPQYLNALNFDNGLAIVLELIKVRVGTNEVLGKNVAYDKYLEAVIDVQGNIKGYVSPKRTNVLLDKKFLRQPPKIATKKISNNLYALLNKNNTWDIKVIN